jgi:hypothetical protein
LTVASLLVAAVDPDLLQRAMRSVGSSISDAVSAVLQFDPSLLANLAGTAGAIAEFPQARCSVAPSWYVGSIRVCPVASSSSPARSPTAVRGTPVMGPGVSRPITPAWWRAHLRFAV